MTVTLPARAKINWALNITGRRDDGYHVLDMLMQTIELCDTLTFERADALSLRVNGAPVPPEGGNLVLRAARALLSKTGARRGARIDLIKRIPERAGLGGGSADCALTLRALNRLWALGLSREQLLEIGESLGADVPFCLTGGLCRVRGIGEILDPLPGAPEVPLVLVRPGDGLSTADVFRLWDGGQFPAVTLRPEALADALAAQNLAAADALCANALTAPAVALMPEIDHMLTRLRQLGAVAAFMTGSGSAVVGAFRDAAAARAAANALPGALLTRTLTSLEDGVDALPG